MANQTILIHRKKYAAGLFWQPVSAGNSGGRAYAHRLARSVDGRYSLYTEYNFMIGLSARRIGHKGGMPSAAAEVTDAFSEYSSFLAVFIIPNGFYMVAVRNGIIIVDKIFDNESDVRAEYTKLSKMPDWGAFVAPGAWGMPRAVERTLDDVLTGRSHTVLRSISMWRSIVLSVLLVVLFLLGIMIVYRDSATRIITNKQAIEKIDEEKIAEYRRQIDEKNRELDEQFEIEKRVPPKPIVPPYESLPDVAARADICYRAIGFLMQPISGWTQTTAKCDEKYATVQMKRTYGTIGDFYAIATELMPGAFVNEINEDLLTVRAALPKLDVVPSVDERTPDDIIRDVMTVFQSVNTPVEVGAVVDTVSNGVETKNFDVVEVATSSKLTPMQFMQMFDTFGGVYMTKCDWNANNRTWNYEVIIYAK